MSGEPGEARFSNQVSEEILCFRSSLCHQHSRSTLSR